MKRELSKKTKILILQTGSAPILTYGHESWVMTERVRWQAQTSEMSFLYEESKAIHYLTRCIARRFKNLVTSSYYFFERKDRSLDSLVM